ncbi:hypothetical protein FRC00_011929 [Tulasnella sp. 408]|nr:hypothetical protein FRC00_011929 [Tulasnella sp. 408]
MAMLWYQAKVYYDLLKDPNCSFRWHVEDAGASTDLRELPASIQASLQQPPKPPTSLTRPQHHDSAQHSIGQKAAQVSELEAESSARSADSSSFSVGPESSDREEYRPSGTDYVLREQTHSNHEDRDDGNEPQTNPTDATQLIRPSSSPPEWYAIKPYEEPQDVNVPVDFNSKVDFIKDLSLPKPLLLDNTPMPSLPFLLQHSAKLEQLFPAKAPPVRYPYFILV